MPVRCCGGREFDCPGGRGAPVRFGWGDDERGAVFEPGGREPPGRGAFPPDPAGRGLLGRAEVEDVDADDLAEVDEPLGRGFALVLLVGLGFAPSVLLVS